MLEEALSGLVASWTQWAREAGRMTGRSREGKGLEEAGNVMT